MSVPETYVVKLMAPLLILGYIGGTVPKQHRYYKIYAFLLIIIFICSYIYLSYGKSTVTFDNFSFLVKFSDQIAGLFLTFSGISCILNVFYRKSRNFSIILNHFDLFDCKIGIPVKIRSLQFWMVLILSNVEVLGILFADSWIWLDSIGTLMYNYYFLRNLQIYFMEMRKVLVCWLAMEMCSRFQILIVSLETLSKLECDGKKYASYHFELLKNLKKISNLHNILCDATVLLSESYGLSIVCDVLFAVTISLEYSILMISLTVVNTESLKLHYGMDLMGICCLWITDSFVSMHNRFTYKTYSFQKEIVLMMKDILCV